EGGSVFESLHGVAPLLPSLIAGLRSDAEVISGSLCEYGIPTDHRVGRPYTIRVGNANSPSAVTSRRSPALQLGRPAVNPGEEPVVFEHTCGAEFHPLTVCAACRGPGCEWRADGQGRDPSGPGPA